MRYVILGICVLIYLLLGYEALKHARNTDPKKEQGSGSIMFKVITVLAAIVGVIYVMAKYIKAEHNIIMVCSLIYIAWTSFAVSEFISHAKIKKTTGKDPDTSQLAGLCVVFHVLAAAVGFIWFTIVFW